MAKKPIVAKEDKLDNQDLNLFGALEALDKKDYGYYDKLTPEQQKKFVPYMMILWMSAVKSNVNLQRYYVLAVNEQANKYFFNEYIQQHPKLQWMMLCASSPNKGKQFHQWVPSLREAVCKLRDPATMKEAKEYFAKIYPKANPEDVAAVSEAFIEENKKKYYLAKKFPQLKFEDLELLSTIVTDDEIKNYERDLGNE